MMERLLFLCAVRFFDIHINAPTWQSPNFNIQTSVSR